MPNEISLPQGMDLLVLGLFLALVVISAGTFVYMRWFYSGEE